MGCGRHAVQSMSAPVDVASVFAPWFRQARSEWARRDQKLSQSMRTLDELIAEEGMYRVLSEEERSSLVAARAAMNEAARYLARVRDWLWAHRFERVAPSE
jgi:methionine salvage enolase-phosphatase E1